MSNEALRREFILVLSLVVAMALFFLMPERDAIHGLGPVLQFLIFVFLVGLILMCAFRALSHAGELGHRLGEPQGSLLLTLSILSIEISLIVAVMLTGKPDPTMARDTMFAGFMLTMNGVVGVVLLAGGLRHRQQEFNLEGARAYLAALVPLAVIALVLPNFTKSQSGMLTDIQAVSIGVATILFYFIFLGVQTMRYREFFLDVEDDSAVEKTTFQNTRTADVLPSLVHFGILIFALALIMFMGRELAKVIDYGIHRLGVPTAIGGIVIAMLTLTPESVSAFKAALDDKLQHSVNVFLGGALSTIGLTVPCVLITGLLADRRVVLGLQGTDMVLLILTLLVSTLTFGGVRTNALQGAVHLLIFLLYLMLIISP